MAKIREEFRQLAKINAEDAEDDERVIREVIYALERTFGADKVVEQFEFVRENDDSFE